MSLPKMMVNNGKMWTSVEPYKIYIIGKVLMRAIQKCNFIEFEPLHQKLWAFMSNFPKPLEIVKCRFWRKLPLLPLLWHTNTIDGNSDFPIYSFTNDLLP